MEVTSSTAATTSSSTFGQAMTEGEEDEQNQPLSSSFEAAGAVAAASLDEADGTYGTSSGGMLGPLQYGPVVCPDLYSQETSYCKDIRDSRAVHGSCGLYNLGNTCFMNSGLQSLMSCSPLVKFFSENFHLEENNHNTLTGHFFILLCKMWCGQYSVVHPKKFKEFLGFYHSQFEDYRQHDCQEFLAFLLDTLHEQLNVSIHSANNNLSYSSLPLSSAAGQPTALSSDGLGVAVLGTVQDVSCSETELSRHREFHRESFNVVDNFNHKSDDLESSTNCLRGEGSSIRREDEIVESSDIRRRSRKKLNVNVNACSELSEDQESSVTVVDNVCGISSHEISISTGDGDVSGLKTSDDDDSDIISSSGSSLKRYTSRSNLDDVSSSDVGFALKPSLKRVSTDTTVTASGLTFSSEDSNQSSISVHSTDSEQSSTFKRLKIESMEVCRGTNSNCNSSNGGSMKDFAVTSSSDCHHEARSLKQDLGMGEELVGLGKSDESVVSSNLGPSMSASQGREGRVSSHNAGYVMSTCHEDPMESLSSSSSSDNMMEQQHEDHQMQCISNLEDFYKKETKTLNTNVLISEHSMPEISCDSEKFAKVDNRQRRTSREINLLQEVFDDEDKVEKVLIGQQFAIKDTNLHTHQSTTTSKLNSSNKSSAKSQSTILNNCEGDPAVSCHPMSLHAKQEVSPPLKMENDVTIRVGKLDEAEKNVQMQAYSKFNTTPPKSNIRIDLTDSQAVAKADNDEVEEESSDEEEMDKRPSHASNVEECSSIPNCLRTCLPSEVAMANQAWQDYKSRNNSIVVSTFQGQFRSTVVCSECNHVSVTYEPFMYLSLPIPHAMEIQMCVIYISQSKSPVRYLLNMMKTDKVITCKKKLMELVGTSADMVMAEILDSHVSRILDDNVLLKYVNMFNRKIYAFEIVHSLSRSRTDGGGDDDNGEETLLNNEGRHHHEDSMQQDDDQCLVSTSRSEVTDLLPYRTDSQLSNQSLDSIHVNTPSSRDTMDLGFSDSEMCEEDASLSSPRQRINLSPSYFEEKDVDAVSHRGGDSDDLCQSTTSDNPWIHKGGGLMSTALSANNAHCLSWQIMQEKNTDDCDEEEEAASTVVRSSSSVSGDDCIALCSSSTRFWVDRPDCQSNQKEANLILNSIENTSLTNNDDEDNAVENGVVRSCDIHKGPSTTLEFADSFSADQRINLAASAAAAGSTSDGEEGDDDDDDVGNGCDDPTHGGGVRLWPSPQPPSEPMGSSHALSHHSIVSASSRLEENPGSYFMQSPELHTMESICHTDTFGTGEDQPMNEDAEAKCLTDNWTTFDHVDECRPPQPALEKVEEPPSITAASYDQWRSCAICLEDLPTSQMLIHVSCDGVFCQSCLDMSVKHTADVSFFCCPICLHPANVCQDFVPLPTSETAKLQARMLTMCLAFRHLVIDNTGASSLHLVGHPKVVEMSSVMAGDELYILMDRLMGRPHLTYSVLLTDGQGLNCSRCPYSAHCMGCEIAREGQIFLRPSDNLTVHSCDALSAQEVLDMQFVYDDPSMASLRSSEPTTIMDCFGAFTQSELLDEHNPWYCPMCERNQCAKKTMTVWRYPDNLIIHLKRFVYQDLSSTKVDTKVVFPHTAMDVRGFLSGPSSPGLIYDLYSVICHFGGASSGHYTCFAHHPLTSEWYYYNDEMVSQQSPSDSEHSSGYLLFYQRQGMAVDFSPPPFLPYMEDNYCSTNTNATTNSTTTFHQASTTGTGTAAAAAASTVVSTTTTTTTTSSKPNHHDKKDNMALVLFIPPSSTTTSPPHAAAAAANQQQTTSTTPLDEDDKDHDDDDDDDKDDYDCEERRCSPSSDYGSLSVHFDSLLPDPDNLMNEYEGDEAAIITNMAGGGEEEEEEDVVNDNGSPVVAVEPDSTFDFYW